MTVAACLEAIRLRRPCIGRTGKRNKWEALGRCRQVARIGVDVLPV